MDREGPPEALRARPPARGRRRRADGGTTQASESAVPAPQKSPDGAPEGATCLRKGARET